MMEKLEQLGGPWQTNVKSARLHTEKSGRQNPGWGCIDTENQRMSAAVNFFSYRLRKDPKVSEDYHAVYGVMRHGVTHHDGVYRPADNWVSVGYYARRMSLVLEISGDGDPAEHSIWDAGPTSTVGENTTSFSIGGNLSGTVGDFETASAGLDASFGTSFSSPDVVIGMAAMERSVRWDVQLPGVGFKSPGIPANPFEPSYAGYQWYFGAIFKTPGGVVPTLHVHPRIEWIFDWTRGITNHEVTWEESGWYSLALPEGAETN